MSNSKHYVLSFTTLFCNKKGYVLMFNRHQNVHHVDNFPLSFEPWNRYSALIMRDMKMGTKVKRATGVLHSALANFKTIFEGNNPDELKKGSLFYLSNLSENLTRSKLNPTYGVADKPDKINDFYAHFGDIIDKVNAQVVRSITLPSDLVKTKIIENGKEILTVEGGLTLANYGDGVGLEILRLLNLEGEESVLEVLALLHQQGYNQAIELADLLFKGGELSTADRLLTIQYGEKAVDMAKANFVKVVLDSLADLLVNGKKIEVVTLDGLPSNFEVFEVVGYGFLDEFQKPHANVKSQEIIEIVDSTKFTDVFNSSVDSLDDAANVKKNIESVGKTTADAVVTYADGISTDASEKLMTDGSLEKSVDVMIVKSGGGRYEQPETSTLVINDNNSPIHLDESIANPKMYEGLISSVEFSDDVSNKHDAVLEDSVAVIVTAEGQQLKYDEGVTPHVYGDVLTLDSSSKKHYYADESVYDGGTPYKESNHSSDETTEATSLKFSVGSVETSSATAIKNGGGGTQGFEHGSFYKSAVAEGGSEEFIVYRYVYGDDSVEESKYVGYMDMYYLEDPTVYMSDYVIEVPEIEQGTVLTQSETFSEHDSAVTLFYSHESDNTVRGILSPIKELSPIDEFGQVVSVWWGSKDVLDLMETKGYGEYDDGLDTTESSGIVYGLYEGFDTSQDSVKLGDIEESTQGVVQRVSYIVDDSLLADDVYYGSEQEEQELALLLRHGSEPSELIKGDVQYVEGLEDDVESAKSLDVGLIVFFEKPNIERKVEASLDTPYNGNSLRYSYNSDSVELFNSLWMGSRPQVLEGSNDFRIGVGRDGMSTSALRKEGSGALSVDEVGNYRQGSSEDVLERTSYFTKGYSSDGYNVSEKRQEEGAVLPPMGGAISIGGGGEISGFELSDGHKEGVKSDELVSFSSYVQGSQESDLGSFKNTATGEEEKNLIMSDTVIEGNYPVKAEQLRKTSIEGVESNQEISDSGLIVSATKDDLTLSNNFKQAHAADNVFVAGSVLGGEGVGSLESSGSYLNSEGYTEYDTFKLNANEAERSSLDELNMSGLEGHIPSISTTVNNNKLGELSESALSDISYLEGSAVEQFASPTGFVEGNQEDEFSEFNGIVEGYKEQTLSYFESIVVGDNPNIKVAAISYSEGQESLLESSTPFTKTVITSEELFDKVSVEADDLSYEVSKDSVIVNGVLETGEYADNFKVSVGLDSVESFSGIKESIGYEGHDNAISLVKGSVEEKLDNAQNFVSGSVELYQESDKGIQEGSILPYIEDTNVRKEGGSVDDLSYIGLSKEGVESDVFSSFSSYVQGQESSKFDGSDKVRIGDKEETLADFRSIVDGNFGVSLDSVDVVSVGELPDKVELSEKEPIYGDINRQEVANVGFEIAAEDGLSQVVDVKEVLGIDSLESTGSRLESDGYEEYLSSKRYVYTAKPTETNVSETLAKEGTLPKVSEKASIHILGSNLDGSLANILDVEGSIADQFISSVSFLVGDKESEVSNYKDVLEGDKPQSQVTYESVFETDTDRIEAMKSIAQGSVERREESRKLSVEGEIFHHSLQDRLFIEGATELSDKATSFSETVGIESTESFSGVKESIGYEEYSEAKSLFSGFIPMLHVVVEKRHVEGLSPINGERASGYQEAKEPHRLESHSQIVNSDDVVSLELFVGYLDGGNELIKLSLSDVVVQGGGVEQLSLSDVTVLGRDEGDKLDLSTTSREGYVIGVDDVGNVNSEGFVFGYEETNSNTFFGIYDDLSLPQYVVRQAEVDKQIASDGNVVVFGTVGNDLSSMRGYREGKESSDTETANTFGVGNIYDISSSKPFVFVGQPKEIDNSVAYVKGGSPDELDKTEKSQSVASIVAHETSMISPYIGDKPHDLDKGGTYRYAGKGVSIESSNVVSEGVDTRGNEQASLKHFEGLVSTQVGASKQGVEGDLPRYLENPRKYQLSSILIPMESSYSSVYEYGDIDLFVGMFNVLGIEIFEYDTVDTTKFAGVVDGLEETDTSVVSLGIVDEQSVSSSQTTSYGNLVEYDKADKLYIIGDVVKFNVPEISGIGYGSVDEIEATTDEKFFFGVILKADNTDSGIVRHATLDLADGAEYRSVYLADMLASDVANYRNYYQADLVGVNVSDKFVIGGNSPELSDGDLIYRLSDISVGESVTVTVGDEGELYRLDAVSTEDEKEVELHWGTYGFKGENEQDVVVEDVDTVNKVDNTLDLIVDGEDMAIRITDVLDIHLDRKSVSAMQKEEILDVSTESTDNGIKLEVTFDTLLSNAVRGVRQETTMDTDVSDIEVFDILDPVLDVHVGDHEFAHKNEVVLNTVVEDIELAAREGETFDVSLHLTEKSLRQDYDLDVAVDLQELANSIDRMFDVSVEVTEYGDKNEGALDVYVELHDVATKDEVADTVVDKGVMAAGAERTPDVEVHSFDMSGQSDEDRDVDVFIPTTAELEKEDDIVLEFSGTAETTRTDDILLEGQDVAYGGNTRDVVLEFTSTADSGRTSDVVVVESPDMATGGNSYDVFITLSENGVTNASSDVVVEDVQKAIANAGVDVNIEGISLASADGTRDVTVELPELADSNDHAYDVEFVVHDLAITDKTDDVLVELTDFASTDTTTDVGIELPDFATTSDAVRDVAIETQDLAETDITTDVVVGVAELAELHKTDDVAIDGTDFGTSEKDVDVVVEETVTADSDSHVDVSIEYGDMADSYEDVDVTIETPVLAGQDSTTDTVIEDIDLADSNSSADVVIDSEVLAESGNEHDVVIEDFDFADSSQEVDAVVETPEMADSSETADTVIEEPEMATSENTSDVVVDDTELAEPSNTFHDVIVEDFTPSTRGRKRLLDLMEEEEFEPVGDRLIDIYEEEEVTSGGSTIMILEEEELAEPTTTSYISIEDDELADRTHSSLLEIDEDEETRPTSTKGIVIEDDEQVTKYKSLNDITIEGEEEGHREREFGVTIDFEDEGAKLGREFPIDIDDDDPGIGLPPTNPPWEEPQPKGKIWLIMGKPFPAWNGWNNKKTR